MQHAPQQLTDQEFNLGWVFSQLLALDVDRPLSSEGAGDPHHDGKPPTAKKRRSINQQTEFSEPNSNHAQLTAAHIKHVFDAMKVQLSTDEAEEVLSLMDDNQDGRVTIEDFWQTMKVTPSSPFDSRYAVNLPFGGLDSSTKDGVITDEDYRHARAELGKVFGCDNDGEFNQIMRALAAAGCGPAPPTATSAAAAASQRDSIDGPITPTARKAQLYLDKDAFRKVVGTNRIHASDSPSHTPIPTPTQRSAGGVYSHSISSIVAKEPQSSPHIVISLIPASPGPQPTPFRNPSVDLKLDLAASPTSPTLEPEHATATPTPVNTTPTTTNAAPTAVVSTNSLAAGSTFTIQQPQSARPTTLRKQSNRTKPTQPHTTTNATATATANNRTRKSSTGNATR